MALCSLCVDQGHEVFPAKNGGNLQGVFGGDNSSRVVELDDDDLMEDVNQQAAAPMYQQPQRRYPPALKNDVSNFAGYAQGGSAAILPNTASDFNQQAFHGPGGADMPFEEGFNAVDEFNPPPGVAASYDTRTRYYPYPPADSIHGMRTGYIQHPSMYSTDNTNAYMDSAPHRSQQQPPPSNTSYVAPGYTYNGMPAYDLAPRVDAGLGSPSQWSTQYNWQPAIQDADVAEHGHGKQRGLRSNTASADNFTRSH